jgi:hypothetical protein
MPATLNDLLLTPEKRPAVVADCEQLVHEEVAGKKGPSGVAVKGGFGVVKKVKPGIIHDAVDSLTDDFVSQLSPLYADYVATGSNGGFGAYLTGRSDQAAEGLLSVTDRRAERSQRPAIKKAYDGLRPKGKDNVVAALHRLGALIDKHTVTY